MHPTYILHQLLLPWFKAIAKLSWDFIGRGTLYYAHTPESWLSIRALATTMLKFIGQVKLTKRQAFIVNLYLMKQASIARQKKVQSNLTHQNAHAMTKALAATEPYTTPCLLCL